MKTYPPDELLRFLDAIDRHLESEVTITLIGGSAAAIGYGLDTATKDIDTFEGTGAGLRELLRAAEKASAETGLEIPIGPAGVAEAPWDCESRRVAVLPKLVHLRVLVLERHDLVLSKLVRGVEGDMEHIRQLHALVPLSYETLVSRFLDEMGHVIGQPIDINFLNCIEMLFGELRALDAGDQIKARRAQPLR
jgi:hypothetical protein